MVLHHFSAAIIIGRFFSLISTQCSTDWLLELCMFVGFIIEADVSAGIMEIFRVLLRGCCFFILMLPTCSEDEHFGVFRLNTNKPLRCRCICVSAVVKGVSGEGLVVVLPR